MEKPRHIPVLFEETLSALAVRPGGRYIDGTLGRAGHARGIVAAGGTVLGIDRDEQALAEIGDVAGITAVKGRHAQLLELAQAQGWTQVDGVLLDLGVSSPQLDDAERGFSFMRDGPLDMRMDRAEGRTAADIVNETDEADLAAIFSDLGEERHARRLAKAICRARERGVKFTSTLQLADFVESQIGRSGAHHPATRVFQALRMEVNDEVRELEAALRGGLEVLAPGGRMAVITFESITDRIVKSFFAEHVGRMVSLQQGGSRWEGALPKVTPVFKKSISETSDVVNLNPRSRSARLRAVQKEPPRCETKS